MSPEQTGPSRKTTPHAMRGHLSLLFLATMILAFLSSCGGGGGGRGKARLIVSVGANNPGSTSALPPETDVPILQFSLLASGDSLRISEIRFHASGTGDEVAGISEARLFRDSNGDAALDPGDIQVGGPAVYPVDDGEIVFSGLSEILANGTSVNWLLVYDISSSPMTGEIFCADLLINSDVVASGNGGAAQIEIQPGIQGCATMVTGPLLVSATFVDVNANGLVDLGDTVTATFSQAVSIQGTPIADDVFVLDPTGWLGNSFVTPGGAPEEVLVVLNSGLAVQPNGTYGIDPGSSGLNLFASQIWIVDSSGSPIPASPAPVDLAGVLNPRVRSIMAVDVNGSCTLDAGDTLEVGFTASVTFTTSDPAQAFQLPVSGDTLGTGASFLGGGTPVDVRVGIVVLGTVPSLTLNGTYDPAILAPGAPSGLDIDPVAAPIMDAIYAGVLALPYTPPGIDAGAFPMPIWTTVGDDQPTADLGFSVASAGDVNNDTYPDIIVGAYRFATMSGRPGKAYVYLGGPSGLSSIPGWTSSGDDRASAEFGNTVASAGDVNGDGYDDVIIGARNFAGTGKAYVYLGGPAGLSPTPVWTSSGDNQAGAGYGWSVASAGDVNMDTYDDIVVGAGSFDTPSNSYAGKAYVYLGGPAGLSATPIWTSSGDDQMTALYGWSVASAGDVNNDGYSDIIVGARRANADVGKAFVYHGGSGGPSLIPAWSANGDGQPGADFGVSVASAGDVNNDLYSDVIIGADRFDAPASDAGKAYVYLGSSAGLSTTAVWSSSGDGLDRAQFGYSVASAGDVDADGYWDVIVGAYRLNTPNSGMGKVYVYLGSSSGPALTPRWTSSGDDRIGANFGGSVASAGDVTGDLSSEIIVGAPEFVTPTGGEGKAYVFRICP
ncbi:MAG: integrin alpha [Planctomycetota bacterium]|nr:integrin alpha [Planctomycetota bacterium]